MYQDFFRLKTLPFGLTPNLDFYCELKGHQEALQTLLFSIKSGEGFVKIIGEVGCGKTLLCRKLLEALDKDFISAYVPNPDLTPLEMRKTLARELGLNPSQWEDQPELLTAINQQLIALHSQGKKIVLIIDEAQALSDESLETVRLFTNLETESSKLLQVILFGQPELNDRLNQSHLRQLKQRITFSYTLPLLSDEDLQMYLSHRLAVAGHTHGNLFTKKALKILFRASRGVPRLVNILGHKALLAAYGRGEEKVTDKAMYTAVQDTEAVIYRADKKYMIAIGVLMLTLMAIIFLSLT